MNADPNQLINGHLDCSLSPDEQVMLNDWIKSDSKNADRFVAAVMLHNRIYVHYQSLQATLDHLDHIRVAAAPKPRRLRGLAVGASVACLLLAAFLYFRVPTLPNAAATAVAEFHELVAIARKPGDRTYRVTFVKDKSDAQSLIGGNRKQAENVQNNALLYVRDGRQFVYTWMSADGRQSFIGSDGKKSWAYRVGEQVVEDGDPMHFTGGLPGGNYLAPIVSFFEGQEKLLVADYNLEVRHPKKTENVFLAGKKPDTKQGPRRIEITFTKTSGLISQMRIWPETPDHHKKMDFTLIELANVEPLAAEWFTPVFHAQPNQPKLDGVNGAAD